jgi:protein involved in polysaccharide export with SLBB domain
MTISKSAIAMACVLLLLASVASTRAQRHNLDTAASRPNDRPIKIGDKLLIWILDLNGEGTGDTLLVPTVDKNGNIRIPYIDPLAAENNTPSQMEQIIAAAYRDAKVLRDAQVSVSIAVPRPPSSRPARPPTSRPKPKK